MSLVDFIKRIEQLSKAVRAKVFFPLNAALAFFHIPPSLITLFGLAAAAAMFVRLSNGDARSAGLFFLLYFLFDAMDGSLARHLGTASDKGKFIDVTADSIAVTLMLLGLISFGAINPVLAGIFIYLLVLENIFSIIIHNHRTGKTGWLFHARGGFRAHMPKNLFYAVFLLWTFDAVDWMETSLYVFNTYLSVLALYDFVLILTFKKNE